MKADSNKDKSLAARNMRKQSAVSAVLAGGAAVIVLSAIALLGGLSSDSRYNLLIIIVLSGAIAFALFRAKRHFLLSVLTFSLCLRAIKANIGKRFPALEIAYPSMDFFEVLLLASLIYLLYRWAFKGKKMRFPDTPEHKFFLALVAAFLFSLSFVTPTWQLGFARTLTVVEMYLFYVVSFNLVETAGDVSYVVKALLATVGFEVVLVGLQMIIGGPSPLLRFFAAASALKHLGSQSVIAGRLVSGSFGTPVVFGWAMSFLFFALLPFALIGNLEIGIARRMITFALGALFAFGLLTMTRTSIVGQLLIAPVGIYLLAKHYRRRLLAWMPRLAFLFTAVVVLSLVLPGAYRIISNRSTNTLNFSESINLRVVSMEVGLRILEAHPVFGLGVGVGGLYGFRQNLLADYLQNPSQEAEISYAGIHNGHAVVLAEMGVVGYALYLLFWGGFMRRALIMLKGDVSLISKQLAAGAIMLSLFVIFSDFTGVALSFKSAMLYVSLWFGLLSAANLLETRNRTVEGSG